MQCVYCKYIYSIEKDGSKVVRGYFEGDLILAANRLDVETPLRFDGQRGAIDQRIGRYFEGDLIKPDHWRQINID